MNPLVLVLAAPLAAQAGDETCERAVRVPAWVVKKADWQTVVGEKLEEAGHAPAGTCVVAGKKGEKPTWKGVLESQAFVEDDSDEVDFSAKRRDIRTKGADWVHIQIHGSDFNSAKSSR